MSSIIKIITTFCFIVSLINADSSNENVNLKFLIADERGIWKIENDLNNPILIVEAPNITTFDFHLEKNLLFYNDAANEKIYSRPLFSKSSEAKLIISQPEKWAPISISVDYVNDKLYILDAHSNKIDVFDLDGKNHAVAVGFGFTIGDYNNYNSKLILDPYFGKMFINDREKIMSYNMDGSSNKIITKGSGLYHNSFLLGIDSSLKDIYWGNFSLDGIESSTYDGHNKRAYNISLGNKEFSFFISEKRIYLVHGNTLKVISLEDISKTSSSNLPLIKNAKFIKPLQAPKQLEVKNPCKEQNVNCQQLCFTKLSETKTLDYSCGCKIGYYLSSNKKSCTTVEDFAILQYGNHIKSYALNAENEGFNQAMIPIAPESERWYEFVGLGCDANERKIYYSTHGENCMYYSKMNDNSYEKLLDGYKNSLRDLSFDWVSKNVYFAAYSFLDQGEISVVNPKNPLKVKTILKNLYQPDKLIVHPNKGYLFYMMHRTKEPYGTVLKRINVDGTGLQNFDHLNSMIGRIWHMAIDYSTDRVYWTDTGIEGVKHVNLDGGDYKEIINTYTSHSLFLDIYKEYLFVRTYDSGFYRLSKTSGELSKNYDEVIGHATSGFRICGKDAQKISTDNPCFDNNGGCEEFCFAVPNNDKQLVKVCGCSDGKILNNGTTCIKSEI